MTKNISPNQLQEAAIRLQLDGNPPESEVEWAMCVNFWAANVAVEEVVVCQLMARLYDCPLDHNEIEAIAQFQVRHKRNKESIQ